eukprot:GHVN01053777.1.p1 GENE.GHVN01053777.1~~GHVN01053777.1.p1  ORF type:complete len:1551 (+),score=299.61 GHVN01053777.1:611-4654(+)
MAASTLGSQGASPNELRNENMFIWDPNHSLPPALSLVSMVRLRQHFNGPQQQSKSNSGAQSGDSPGSMKQTKTKSPGGSPTVPRRPPLSNRSHSHISLNNLSHIERPPQWLASESWLTSPLGRWCSVGMCQSILTSLATLAGLTPLSGEPQQGHSDSLLPKGKLALHEARSEYLVFVCYGLRVVSQMLSAIITDSARQIYLVLMSQETHDLATALKNISPQSHSGSRETQKDDTSSEIGIPGWDGVSDVIAALVNNEACDPGLTRDQIAVLRHLQLTVVRAHNKITCVNRFLSDNSDSLHLLAIQCSKADTRFRGIHHHRMLHNIDRSSVCGWPSRGLIDPVISLLNWRRVVSVGLIPWLSQLRYGSQQSSVRRGNEPPQSHSSQSSPSSLVASISPGLFCPAVNDSWFIPRFQLTPNMGRVSPHDGRLDGSVSTPHQSNRLPTPRESSPPAHISHPLTRSAKGVEVLEIEEGLISPTKGDGDVIHLTPLSGIKGLGENEREGTKGGVGGSNMDLTSEEILRQNHEVCVNIFTSPAIFHLPYFIGGPGVVQLVEMARRSQHRILQHQRGMRSIISIISRIHLLDLNEELGASLLSPHCIKRRHGPQHCFMWSAAILSTLSLSITHNLKSTTVYRLMKSQAHIRSLNPFAQQPLPFLASSEIRNDRKMGPDSIIPGGGDVTQPQLVSLEVSLITALTSACRWILSPQLVDGSRIPRFHFSEHTSSRPLAASHHISGPEQTVDLFEPWSLIGRLLRLRSPAASNLGVSVAVPPTLKTEDHNVDDVESEKEKVRAFIASEGIEALVVTWSNEMITKRITDCTAAGVVGGGESGGGDSERGDDLGAVGKSAARHIEVIGALLDVMMTVTHHDAMVVWERAPRLLTHCVWTALSEALNDTTAPHHRSILVSQSTNADPHGLNSLAMNVVHRACEVVAACTNQVPQFARFCSTDVQTCLPLVMKLLEFSDTRVVNGAAVIVSNLARWSHEANEVDDDGAQQTRERREGRNTQSIDESRDGRLRSTSRHIADGSEGRAEEVGQGLVDSVASAWLCATFNVMGQDEGGERESDVSESESRDEGDDLQGSWGGLVSPRRGARDGEFSLHDSPTNKTVESRLAVSHRAMGFSRTTRAPSLPRLALGASCRSGRTLDRNNAGREKESSATKKFCPDPLLQFVPLLLKMARDGGGGLRVVVFRTLGNLTVSRHVTESLVLKGALHQVVEFCATCVNKTLKGGPNGGPLTDQKEFDALKMGLGDALCFLANIGDLRRCTSWGEGRRPGSAVVERGRSQSLCLSHTLGPTGAPFERIRKSMKSITPLIQQIAMYILTPNSKSLSYGQDEVELARVVRSLWV